MLELNKIYNEDCMGGLKRIGDKSIDMVLTDLPYGTTNNKWDKRLPLDELFRELNRVIKDNGCMAFTCQQPFETDLINANRKYFRYEWTWDKCNPVGFLNANKMPLRRHENVAVFYKRLPTYNPQFTEGKPYLRVQGKSRVGENYGNAKCGAVTTVSDGRRFPTDIITVLKRHGTNVIGNEKHINPTQKPVELFEYFIKTYTNEGEVVLDCCMGSGTTAVACINTGRQYIGFETDKEYWDKSLERIAKLQGGKII